VFLLCSLLFICVQICSLDPLSTVYVLVCRMPYPLRPAIRGRRRLHIPHVFLALQLVHLLLSAPHLLGYLRAALDAVDLLALLVQVLDG